ncbi:Nucleotide-diphospho-sugar transferase [Sesbania bispinosa]|nr:Nucleotide-diphospho-sugar transferase [Sesbania bispinosa]
MDHPWHCGWSCNCSSCGCSRLPDPIQQIPYPGRRHHTRPIRFLSVPGKASGSNPWQTHDPVVATDDEKIADCCRQFGADVIMTSESCRNGTERCNEALQKLGKKYDIVVNIQGDEPLIEPEIIDGVVKALQAAPDAVFSTAVTSLKPEDAHDPNRVKCVVDNCGYAIYFSRGLIPFNKSGKVNQQFPYLLHLGIQSYDAKFLKIYSDLQPTPLQLEEDLEQLKVLENGYKMKVIKVNHEAHGVDAPEDVEKIESLMRERNLS